MPRELKQLPDGTRMTNEHVRQLIEAWYGTANKGIPLRATEVSDGAKFAGAFRNKGAGGKALQAQKSSGTAVLEATDSGVKVSPDGSLPLGNWFVMPNMVVGWHGKASEIPSGWEIVFAGRFLYGAVADTPEADGGAETHLHDFGHAHRHAHTHVFDHVHRTSIDHDHGEEWSGLPKENANHANDGTVEVDNNLDIDTVEVAQWNHVHSVDVADYDVASKVSDGPKDPASSTTDKNATDSTTITDTAPEPDMDGTWTFVNTGDGKTSTDTTTGTGSSLPPYGRVHWIRKKSTA